MSNTILVPVDFSDNSLQALKYAADFAKTSNASILILNVKNDDSINDLRENLSPEHLIKLVQEEEYMKGINVSGIIREGAVTHTILEEAKDNKVSMIIMGTQGAGNMTRNLIGTHTTNVIAKSECIVFAVPAKITYRKMKKAVLAIDLKHRADKEVLGAVRFLSKMEVAVFLVYVTPQDHTEDQDALDAYTAKLKTDSGYAHIEDKVIHAAHFNKSIENFIQMIDADVLVTITHHRNVYESIFDPSHTQKMAYHLHTPLLAIPQKHESWFFF